MKTVAFLIIVSSAAFQSLIAFYWTRASARGNFSSVFHSFYGKVPVWSEIAFSFGLFWLAVPIGSIAALAFAWSKKMETKFLWKVGGVSLMVTVAMIYAMYPIHLMLRDLP